MVNKAIETYPDFITFITSEHPCKGDTTIISSNIARVDYISPFFNTDLHENRHTNLERECNRLHLSIHDRHEVQAALDRGENMQEFAQKIIRRVD